MTRTIFLFEDGTCRVNGIDADALGDADDLPFLTEHARIKAAKSALAQDELSKAEIVASRQVISPSQCDQVIVRFVSPPDWERYGNALWNSDTGETHSVFHRSTLLVDGIAVPGCVGLPFKDEISRRECAIWCLRNGLENIAEQVARTPVGGDGPHCTWPEGSLEIVTQKGQLPVSDRSEDQVEDKNSAQKTCSVPVPAEAKETETPVAEVVNLFGGVYGISEL
ncbi:MAG: hypothetical protein AAF665_02265 [Pseudomonadota bacterium]